MHERRCAGKKYILSGVNVRTQEHNRQKQFLKIPCSDPSINELYHQVKQKQSLFSVWIHENQKWNSRPLAVMRNPLSSSWVEADHRASSLSVESEWWMEEETEWVKMEKEQRCVLRWIPPNVCPCDHKVPGSLTRPRKGSSSPRGWVGCQRQKDRKRGRARERVGGETIWLFPPHFFPYM